MSYGPKIRRQRRRRSLILWGVAGLAIAIAFGVTGASGDSELARVYLDLAFDVAKTAREASLAFSSMIDNIEDFDRAAMIKLLERPEHDKEGLVDELDAADPPEFLQEGHLFLRIATTTWRGALSDSKLGLIALTENVLDEDGLATLTRGLVDLRVGDSAYVGFLSSLTDVDTELQGGDPPIVSFVPSDLDGLFDAQELARRLFLTENLGPVQDVAVADLRLEPASVGEQEGLAVLAITPNQTVEVTISNRGNIAAAGIGVQVSLISNAGDLWEARQEIPLLGAGELTTLVFSNLPVEPGTIYEIIVTSLFDDDEDGNDRLSMLFLVNPEG